jgi:hypothetical protein
LFASFGVVLEQEDFFVRHEESLQVGQV